MILIKNANIYTMAGYTIENGCVIVEDGKIKAVLTEEQLKKRTADRSCLKDSHGSEIPTVIDAKGKMLIPGIIDAHCHLGMVEDGMGFEGEDTNEMTDPITPELRAIDAINPLDNSFKEAYEGGITTVATGPGSANVIGGQFAVIKTFGRRIDDMIVKHPIAMKLALGENPKSIYGKAEKSPMTRMAIASLLRETLFKTKEYISDKDHNFDIKLEAMSKVISKEIPLKVHVHRTDDIFTAIRIAKEFDVNLTLDHCTEGHLIADYIKKENIDCIVGPAFTDRSKIELKHLTFDTPNALYEAGIRFAIMTDSPEVPVHYLPLCAGLSVKAGLPEEEAFKAITINAAEILGISNRVGSIEVGKDADLVLFSSNPLRDIAAEVLLTVIDGEVVYDNMENLDSK